MTFTDLQQKIASLNVEQIINSVYNETKAQLEDLNTEQLSAGINVNGGTFPKYEFPEYAKLKNKMNPVPGIGNPDLKYTGDFHRSITAEITGTKIDIRSNLTGEKVQNLEQWYSPERIYGLSEEYRIKHIEENINPVFADEIERATGLKMEL